MNRIDRLTAILLSLQGGKHSAREIAQRFEVSRRTIVRDIQALSEMGIPIIAESGSGGGYSLPADYSLPPLALNLHEALLLRLALSSLSQLSELPFKQARESLLDKVQALLPKREHDNLDQLAQALSLDLPKRPYPTPFLDQLLESVRNQQWIEVTYRSENGVSEQTLLPMHLSSSAGLWYCEAYSSERQAMRIYRVDRFLSVREATAPQLLEPPVDSIPREHPSHPEIRIKLTARGVLRLEHQPYVAHLIQRTENGEGWLCMRWRPEEYDWIVRTLLQLGTEARVLAPEDLRLRVQQAIKDLAEHYQM
ncbi:YafY family transcriptional regulator [Ktedonosporobacter rubrisoli]|uniref:YafY family transcriptional regulator n=1 Tax=Ktedonosporobacter rubrisoli TaxID=2509675 RepID=A0A4P6JRF6_KTERU|nr:YafY family protein [Ktedonosporobacter rubrisoli]QBD78047.1 YafY family transcriptional regulator [Ktedonosporobacter rubrisoli]